MIQGPAGIGKTSLLLYLLQFMFDCPELAEFVPFFLPLPSISNVLHPNSIINAIQKTYSLSDENMAGVRAFIPMSQLASRLHFV